MHWNAKNNGKSIPLAVEASGPAARGWFSVAFSFSGLMAPSDAVVGNPGNAVSAYHVASYSSVAPARGINLGAKSCATSGGKTVMKFTRGVGDGGSVPVRVKGVNKIIWGYSNNGGKSVAYHGANIGSTQVDFSCDGSSPVKPTPSPPVKKPPPVPVVPPSKRSKLCPWSTLPGFTYMLQLKPLLLVHWRQVNPNVIEIAMEAKPGSGANNGWLSLAWTRNGRMAPADAVIGNRMGGTLGSYLITGYTMQSLKPAGFSLGLYPTVFKRATGSTVMMFRRGASGGTIPVKPSGLNNLIWAHSPSNSKTLAFHGSSVGRATIDFSCKVAPVSSVPEDQANHPTMPRRGFHTGRRTLTMVTASANGRKAFLVDTLALVRRLEAEGLTAKQSEAITHLITEVLHESLDTAAHTFVSKSEMQKSEMVAEAAMAKVKTEIQSLQDLKFAGLTREVEGLKTDLDKVKNEIRYEVDKVTAGQRLDLNLERGRIKEEITAQTQELSSLSNKMDREVNTLKAELEGAKFEIIRYCIGTLVSVSAIGLGILRLVL
ncbi:unnamed protein product [Closterium sp. Yama58-4]|nr:unnamed protein product [Closterium sp. Yama58-4]